MSTSRPSPDEDDHPTFRVDTHIFRELGELLVGRDSTALLELIKNSYDADATEILVSAVNLDDASRGRIVIQDNGCGMNHEQFVDGFLRIASRFKETGTRRSRCFERRYTGSKGIGRLAAHKLATLMEISSIYGVPSKTSRRGIEATIDWDRIEKQQTLDELDDEITLEHLLLQRPKHPGTTIVLRRLRRPWTDKERSRFVTECQGFQIPDALKSRVPPRVLERPLLFATPILRDTDTTDPGCEIRLDGDFSTGDSYWEPLIDQTNWVLEIDCLSSKSKVKYAIAPSAATRADYSVEGHRNFSHKHPSPNTGPHFQARILCRDEQIRDKQLYGWSRQLSGVRVYLEGFRVLPYGDPGDDWLKLDADTARRSFAKDPIIESLDKEDAGDWQLFVQPNSSYTGAVFLTHDNAPTLKMLVNREGFIADRGFDTLTEIVRRGIDLLTRTRAAAKAPAIQQQRAARIAKRAGLISTIPLRDTRPESGTSTAVPIAVSDAAAGAAESLKELRRLISAGADEKAISQRLDFTQSVIVEVVTNADRLADSAAMLRVLASLGMQMAGFVHEIRSLLSTAVTVHEALERIRKSAGLPLDVKRRLNEVAQSVGDMRRQIERQAAYLIDITSPDARRRRSRQSIGERFESAAKLVRPAADRADISVVNEIPDDLKSAPMFPAELSAVFSNLLTNAVKAAGKGGKIRAKGHRGAEGEAVLVVENTGAAVDLASAEKWFRPFESTTTDVDSVLGQGMGLGLTITRDVLGQYGAMIRFVRPSRGFATALEITFPTERKK